MEFKKRYGRALVPALALVGATLMPGIASAQDAVSAEMFTVNNLWMMIAAALVVVIRVANPVHPDAVVPVLLLVSLSAPLIDHLVIARNVRQRGQRDA